MACGVDHGQAADLRLGEELRNLLVRRVDADGHEHTERSFVTPIAILTSSSGPRPPSCTATGVICKARVTG
jgi:hypothetical protein